MENLSIYDIINNARDELERARELLSDNEDAKESMLLSDIDASLERMKDLNDRIKEELLRADCDAWKECYDIIHAIIEES